MTLSEIKKEARYWQRMLKFAGYYKGEIDGIRGKLQIAAENAWNEAQAKAISVGGSFDERTERNLETIMPSVQSVLRPWLAEAIKKAHSMGYTLKVICGTRSYGEQDSLYDQGRTKPGAKVTNARGGYSNHNFGIAVDIGLFDLRNGKYAENDAPYDRLAKACPPPAAIEWGGSWTSLHDAPHYQWAGYGSGTAKIRKVFNA